MSFISVIKQRHLLALVTCLFLVAPLANCTKKKVEVQLQLTARTSGGDPVDSAEVKLNGELLGVTDDRGQFTITKPFVPGSRHRLEISKESESFYYAPYYDGFEVMAAAGGNQRVPINATLYFVPKPTAEEAARIESEVTAATPAVEEEDEGSEVKDDSETAASPDDSSELTVEAPAAVGPEIALTPVDTSSEEAGASYPERTHDNEGATVFTIHVYSGQNPVSSAMVYMGDRQSGNLKIGCQTNERGRCVIRFAQPPQQQVTFVAKRVGFETRSQSIRVSHQGQLRFDLRRGEAIDIFAIKKTYNFATGINGAEVFVGGRKVGVTDRFGHYSHTYTGNRSDLIDISIRAKNALPESFDTDFVVSGPMSLVRHFTPVSPPPVKLTLLKVQPAGNLDQSRTSAFDGSLDQLIQTAARSSLFASSAFEAYPISAFNQAASEAGRNLSAMIRQGWYATDIKGAVDAVLLPTLIGGRQMALEISLIDSRGQVLAAAKENLANIDDAATINQTMANLTERITRVFPFEGAVLRKEGDAVIVNIGFNHGRALQEGDELEVHGIQSDRLGREQIHSRIATLRINTINDLHSSASITSQEPRTVISRGDLVVLRQRSFQESAAIQIRVAGNLAGGRTEVVDQANLYLNERWIGATDHQGRLLVSPDLAGSSGIMRVVKHGYRDFAQEVNLTRQQRLQISLVRESAFLRIDSQPSNAAVSIDGQPAGRTPISTPIPVPSGFVRVEISGPAGYKTTSKILELDRGTLDLTGANTVVLERDYRSAALRIIESGDVAEGINRLQQIPETHSDYLIAQHEIGELYLTQLKNPARAAEAFGKVTANPAVRQFTDKRFIGSHVNEGIALFLTAESLEAGQPSAARAHYLKAVEVFDQVAPHMRFVPSKQFSQAMHNLAFYRALSFHKLWLQTEDRIYLDQAYRHWRDYVEGSGRDLTVTDQSRSFVDNAAVYFRQAQASIETL